jgi:hypothetical protein
VADYKRKAHYIPKKHKCLGTKFMRYYMEFHDVHTVQQTFIPLPGAPGKDAKAIPSPAGSFNSQHFIPLSTCSSKSIHGNFRLILHRELTEEEYCVLTHASDSITQTCISETDTTLEKDHITVRNIAITVLTFLEYQHLGKINRLRECEFCERVYIGQTEYSIQTRIKKHIWHIRLYHPEKLAMARHNIKLSLHPVSWHQYPGKKIWVYGMYYHGSIETEFHPNNMKREGFSLSKSWKPLIQTLKEQKRAISLKGTSDLLPLDLNIPHIGPFQDLPPLSIGLSFISFLPVAVTPSWAGFTHFPIGSHVMSTPHTTCSYT